MYFSWLALHCDQIYELLKAVASKLATPLASEDADGPPVGPSWGSSWTPLPSSSSVFSLERSPWSAGGRRDPTSAQVDVIVQVDQDEGKDGDDFDDTLKCQHDLTEAKGNMAYQ